MKTYWDTSGLIRAYMLKQTPRGVTRAHAATEFFCVMSGPGLAVLEAGKLVKKALSPKDAATATRNIFAGLEFFDLTGAKTIDALEESTGAGHIIGKSAHDWIHCKAAERCGAERIMTLNVQDFGRMTKLPLEAPV
jgi:hypothetical protein